MSDQEEPFEPLENGPSDAQGGGSSDDRNPDGTFKKGWRGGPGGPGNKHLRQLRQRWIDAMFKAWSPDRLLAAADALLKSAEAGDVQAARLLVDQIRQLHEQDFNERVEERLEAIERQMEGAIGGNGRYR
jgi:hypothetical protein